MAVVAFCTGCGQRQDVPAGYSKGKFRCSECGVIFELPPDIREMARNVPAEEERTATTATARKKPRVKQTEADAAADLLLAPEEAQKPRPPSPPSPRAKAPESPSLPSRSANEPKPSRPPLLEKGAGESDSSEPPDDDDI